MTDSNPEKILETIFDKASSATKKPFIKDDEITRRVDYVCKCTSNRAGVRLLMSCLLGKIVNPKVDPRKPYTKIGASYNC